MKNIHKILGALCLLFCTSQAMAQEEVKPSLEAGPALEDLPAVQAPLRTEATEAVTKPAWSGPQLSYSLSTGMSFSNGFGNTQFIAPSVRYQVSNRFRVNAGLTYLYVSPHSLSGTTPEGTTVLYRNSGGSHYLAHAGIEYLATERLILSGNIWKDFSNTPMQQNMSYNGLGLYSPGRMGMDFRATYKISDNISVTGGMRYTNGASPYANPYHNGPGFGNYNSFGY
ncbi:hypothetical protein ACXYMU_14240 [Pontibacter sp. CAU 1760]